MNKLLKLMKNKINTTAENQQQSISSQLPFLIFLIYLYSQGSSRRQKLHSQCNKEYLT